MTRHPLRGWAAAGIVLASMLVTFVVALMGVQTQSRRDLRERFAERADLSAALTSSVLSSSQATAQAEYAKRFGGRHVSSLALTHWAHRSHTLATLVLDGRGRVLAASAGTPPAARAAAGARPAYVRAALSGAPYGLSNVLRGAGMPASVQYAQPFRTAHGPRVLVSTIPPQLLYAFFGGYLRQVPNDGGRSYVLDANGIVVGAPSRTVAPGRPVHDHALLVALTHGRRGSYGERYFTSSQVPGSGWRVVLTSPRRVLFSSISGTRLWLPWAIVAAFVLAGLVALVALLRGIRNGADLRRSQERYALIVEGSNDGIWDRDLVADDLYVSPRWKELLGIPRDSVVDERSWFARVHPDDRGRLDATLAGLLAGSASAADIEYRIRHEDGSYRWVLVRGAAIHDGDGRLTRLAGSMSDITARKLAEEKLREDALHDSLTGLANRALFLDRLAVALERSQRDPSRRCAVLFLDLDRFKLINDTFSHAFGDELLVELGRRLTHVLRPGDTVARAATGDTVARLGGDEFTILLEDIPTREVPLHVAERILESLEEPFDVDGRTISIGASIGIAFSEPGATPATMMRNADMAMYQAKRDGAPGAALYNDDMHARVSERLDIEIALRHAIERRTLRVFYQPIVDLVSGRLAGFEALARWPEGMDPVRPDEFVAVAEETGLIGGLGRLVLETACAQMQAWRLAGVVEDGATLSVNVSGRQLAEPLRLIEDVRASLATSGLPATVLRLEITESTLISEPERLQETLGELGTIGVRAHIDDFGTGYSSLRFLQHFPGDTLKVDRSFVSRMLEDDSQHEIVRAIVTLAHDLGLATIAEGIDDPGQLGLLGALGCEQGQGFLFSPPVAAEAAATLATGWDPGRIRDLRPALSES